MTWWDTYLPDRLDWFKNWTGSFFAASRVYCRAHIAQKEYKSIIDAGCGLCTEYDGFQSDKYNIDYTGIDNCDCLMNEVKKREINTIKSSVEEINLPDNSADVTYCRHVLEHLDYYEKAISEFIRIASKEVIIVFFLRPHIGEDSLRDSTTYANGMTLNVNHNTYSRTKLAQFILSNKKVISIGWKPIGHEIVLHINLNKDIKRLSDKWVKVPQGIPEGRSSLKSFWNLTLLDKDRVKKIYQFCKKVKNLEGNTAEVGVYKGGISKLISMLLPYKIHYAFDTFEGIPNASSVDKHRNYDFRINLSEVENILDGENVRIVKGIFPDTITEEIRDSKFCLVHCDGDTYQTTKDFLEFFYPRMVKNGIMIFDDYEWEKCPGVKIALDQFLIDKKERIEKTVEAQGIIVKDV